MGDFRRGDSRQGRLHHAQGPSRGACRQDAHAEPNHPPDKTWHNDGLCRHRSKIGGTGNRFRRALQPGKPGSSGIRLVADECGAHHARRQQGHRHPSAAQLLTQCDGHVVQERLGGGVESKAGRRSHTRKRADVEDGAVATLEHARQNRACQAVCSHDIRAQCRLEILGAAVAYRPGQPSPGIVDQPSHGKARFQQLSADAGDGIDIGNIESKQMDADREASCQCQSRHFQLCGVTCDQQQVMAVCRKFARDRKPDAGRPTRDQHDGTQSSRIRATRFRCTMRSEHGNDLSRTPPDTLLVGARSAAEQSAVTCAALLVHRINRRTLDNCHRREQYGSYQKPSGLVRRGG